MANERDTHFAGFAKLLWREMLDLKGGYIDENDGWYRGQNEHPEYEALIARRAYDLVEYALENRPLIPRNTFPDNEEIMKEVPDLTEWPNEPPAPEQ